MISNCVVWNSMLEDKKSRNVLKVVLFIVEEFMPIVILLDVLVINWQSYKMHIRQETKDNYIIWQSRFYYIKSRVLLTYGDYIIL